MKLLLGLLLCSILVVAGCTSPPEHVQDAILVDSVAAQTVTATKTIDMSKSTFKFEGYGPGKSHLGNFTFYSGELLYNNNLLIGAQGIIDATSVSTGIEGLDKHLKSDDFFDVDQYPEILFESTTIKDDMMIGSLTFHGVTQTISFPVIVGENGISADFMLDTTPFNIKYIGVNKEVRILFTMTA